MRDWRLIHGVTFVGIALMLIGIVMLFVAMYFMDLRLLMVAVACYFISNWLWLVRIGLGGKNE